MTRKEDLDFCGKETIWDEFSMTIKDKDNPGYDWADKRDAYRARLLQIAISLSRKRSVLEGKLEQHNHTFNV